MLATSNIKNDSLHSVKLDSIAHHAVRIEIVAHFPLRCLSLSDLSNLRRAACAMSAVGGFVWKSDYGLRTTPWKWTGAVDWPGRSRRRTAIGKTIARNHVTSSKLVPRSNRMRCAPHCRHHLD